MYTNLNPRTMGLNHHPFEILLEAAYISGFRGIEVPAGAFGTLEAARQAGECLKNLGMKFGLIMAPCDMYKVDDSTFQEALDTFGRWAERAKLAGCDRAYNHIWPGSDFLTYDDNMEWHYGRLKAVYETLDSAGIKYGLEYMGPRTVQKRFRYPFISNLSGILQLIQSVSPKIGFVFDAFHWYCSGGGKDELNYVMDHTKNLVNVHLADADPSLSREEQIDNQRELPMASGVIDSVSILRELNANQYDGPVIIEPMSPTVERFAGMDVIDAAKDAISCLKQVFYLANIQS